MKYFGSRFEYEEQRNNDLMRVYREEIAAVDFIRMPDIYKSIVNKPSSRFWVSEERAAIVVSSMMRGESIHRMRPLKREMFQEIHDRVKELKVRYPDKTVYQLTFMVCQQQAPKFYLTAGSAKVIISKIKRRWYEERKRRYRHLY